VQYVLRPDQDYRGYAGRVASGTLRPGEEVLVLPSGRKTTIRSIDTFEGPVSEATAGDSVAISTDDELDISRGDMIVRPLNLPTVGSEIDATICWTSETPMQPGTHYWLRQTTREVKAFFNRIVYRIDVDTLHREEVERFELNDIGRVHLTTSLPVFFDRYEMNRETGSFVLIDPHTNNTVAAGMIRGAVVGEQDLPTAPAAVDEEARPVSPDVVWESWNVSLAEREARNGHPASVVWFTGLPGSGKSSIARGLERRLFQAGAHTMLLDGDQVRHGISGDLGFTPEDRQENVRRVGELASLFFRHGNVVLCTFVSPFRADRDRARSLVPDGRFVEVFVDTPLEECERRDPKGLYARAREGEITHMTGLTSPYEAPESPEVRLETVGRGVEEVIGELLGRLRQMGIVP
jgi:bifunctional enzyme CysN/CysC